jgi:hypothetical protein
MLAVVVPGLLVGFMLEVAGHDRRVMQFLYYRIQAG